jgi:hypothetical protein
MQRFQRGLYCFMNRQNRHLAKPAKVHR